MRAEAKKKSIVIINNRILYDHAAGRLCICQVSSYILLVEGGRLHKRTAGTTGRSKKNKVPAAGLAGSPPQSNWGVFRIHAAGHATSLYEILQQTASAAVEGTRWLVVSAGIKPDPRGPAGPWEVARGGTVQNFFFSDGIMMERIRRRAEAHISLASDWLRPAWRPGEQNNRKSMSGSLRPVHLVLSPHAAWRPSPTSCCAVVPVGAAHGG